METLQRTANRGSISTGFNIDNSLKLEPDNSERIQRAHGDIGTPTNQKIVTISFWMKRTELLASGSMKIFEGVAGGNKTWFGWNNDRIKIKSDFANPQNLITTRVFRDTSAWYHIVVAIDTSQGTAANRVKLYINGVQETDFSTESYPNQNNNSYFFESSMAHYIGGSAGTDGAAGYWADFYLLDGQVKGPTDFGEFDEDSGIWTPIAYAGDFGDEGYHIDFKDSSALGADVSGNSNNFGTLTNVSAVDQATDTPTNNFCTWNLLWVYATQATISDGATKTVNASSDWAGAKSTFGLTKGKWYWEYKALNTSSLNGIQTDGESNITASGNAQSKLSTMALFLGGEVEVVDSGGSRDDTNVTFTFNADHTFAIALDMDSSTQTISFYQNGSLITDGDDINIDGLADKTVFPFNAVNNNTVTVNFGGYTANAISSAASDANGYGTFEFAPPSGYYSICTKNLAEYG